MSHRAVFGCTLVEVTLALGLLSFILLAVIGLLSVGLESSKVAQVDTVQSLAVRFLQTQVRANTASGYTGGTYYVHLDGSTNAAPSGAYFQCAVQTNHPAGNLDPANFIGIRMEISYPLAAPAMHRTTNVLHASLAREN